MPEHFQYILGSRSVTATHFSPALITDSNTERASIVQRHNLTILTPCFKTWNQTQRGGQESVRTNQSVTGGGEFLGGWSTHFDPVINQNFDLISNAVSMVYNTGIKMMRKPQTFSHHFSHHPPPLAYLFYALYRNHFQISSTKPWL